MQASEQVLREVFGYDAFRPGQAEVIDVVLAGRDCIGVMPTGAVSNDAVIRRSMSTRARTTGIKRAKSASMSISQSSHGRGAGRRDRRTGQSDAC